jgi:hypothetical protein
VGIADVPAVSAVGRAEHIQLQNQIANLKFDFAI